MSEVLQFGKASAPVADPEGFVMTETAKDILCTLAHVRSIQGPAISMISGVFGVGKSTTIDYYQRQHLENTIVISIAKGEGNISYVTDNILNRFFPPRSRSNNLSVRREEIKWCLPASRILIVRDAQHLNQRNKASCTKGAAYDWLAGASEEAGFDLIFEGDMTLATIMMDFPNVQGRLWRPVVINAATAGDVAATDYGVTDRTIIDMLTAVAKRIEGLWNVDSVMQSAAIFAGGKTVTALHVKAAIEHLKLHTPRGK
jgi:Mu B transposition protein, C terminal